MTVLAQPGFQFEPSTLEVASGTEVVLTLENMGRMSHNLHVPAFGVQTRTIAPNESDTVRFVADEPGTIEFLCEVPGHAAVGMTGTLEIR